MKFGGFGKEWNGKVNRHQCVSNSVWDLDVASSLSSTVSSASCESLLRMPCGVIACPQSVMPVPRTSKGVAYDSAALSLGLTRDVGEGLDAGNARDKPGISRDEDYESRSGSENGDDQDADNPPRKKRYHRHTPQQIQELEALFKECPHPDEKQRLELSRRLNLETRQVKFWFQNRRTQMKTQLERHENSMLREENEKLRVENMSIREAMRNSICSHCGGPVLLGDMNLEQQQLRTENARLKEELERVAPLAERFLGKAIHSSILQKSSLDLGIGTLNPAVTPFPLPFASNQDHLMVAASAPSATSRMGFGMGLGCGIEKSMMAELAFAAMEEFMKMAQEEGPLWVSSSGSGKLSLNYQEYARQFLSTATPKPIGLATEASRETGIVMMRSSSLVETLMDAERWKEMFPCTISRAAMVDVILPGLGGTRNGALQLMYAELQVLSPLVPSREVYFLRFCKQHAEGVWAVVDVSLDPFRETMSPMQHQIIKCRRLPSGCLIQEISSGSSEITWVEHAEYDDRQVHKLYKSLVGSGMAFGAQRWVATLQRRCEFLASATDINDVGRSSMLKLAQRMVENFCAGVSASTVYAWNRISTSNNVEDDVRLMTRKSVDDPGEPPGVVLSAATSFWLPVSPFRLFEFLRDERLRSEWDILSNGGPMLEMTHISKGPDPGNCVSLLKANAAMNASQNSMLILQETCTDTSGSLVVYAPVDIPAMRAVLNGGDPAYVALLPSGFAILPDSPEGRMDSVADGETGVGGSLLTVAFQIVVNSLPTAKLNVESVDTVNKLITCTVQKIKAALQCED